MKVALVRGPILSTVNAMNNEATPCIAFAYISAHLRKKGHEVVIVDSIGEGLNRSFTLDHLPGYRCQGLPFDELIERIPANTEVIGFSGMFSGEWPVLRMLINQVRRRFPGAFLVAGGEHITALTEYSLRDCPALDACVRGEGEHTFGELLEARAEGRPFDQINGVAMIRPDGTYHFAGNAPRIRAIDDISWPDWDESYLARFWAAGKSYGVASPRDMPIMGSRGCPYGCTFCSNNQMWTRRYILRNVDDVIAEIRSYVERFNITALQFYDLTAMTKRAWIIEFCTKMIAEGFNLRWSLPSGTRSEALDEETLALLKQSGCIYMAYAPESGSERTLRAIRKRIDLRRLTASLITAKRLGLTVRTNLIIGFPQETRLDVLKSILYGFRMALLGIDEGVINIFSPYPGTEIFEELVTSGKLEINDAYFLRLSSLNSDFSNMNPFSCNENIGSRELAIYRLAAMLITYALGYILRPARILRTIRNLRAGNPMAATVFEHRLRDALHRRKSKIG